MKTIIYYSRWAGWLIHYNGQLYDLGFLSWGDELRAFCQKNYKRFGWSVGLEGWEL